MADRKYRAIHDESLFEAAQVEPAYPWVTVLSLGLLALYRLNMQPDRIYLVDVGFNDVFVYDQESAQHRSKLFWKLNVQGAPELKVESSPKRHEIALDVAEMPSFDPKFGQNGSWVTIDYQVRVQVEITRQSVGQVRHTSNPLTTVRNAALRAARQVLPFTPYEEALVATTENLIQQRIMADPKVQSTGLTVTLVDVEDIKGSKKLAESLQQSFSRILQARDRREIALQFAGMDREVFQRLIESEEPKAALEFRSRTADQMMQALMASGLNPVQVYSVMGGVARDLGQAGAQAREIGQPGGLAGQIAAKAFEQIKPGDWPPLQIPQRVSHEQRLKWERAVMRERAPAELQETHESSDTFVFLLEPDHKLEIIWSAPEFPPQVYVDGQDRRAQYVALAPTIYRYDKTTIWDIYLETKRALGV